MMKMYSDLLNAVDNNQVSIVVMIDLSAAFDTVDIPTVINILQNDFGIKDTPFKMGLILHNTKNCESSH